MSLRFFFAMRLSIVDAVSGLGRSESRAALPVLGVPSALKRYLEAVFVAVELLESLDEEESDDFEGELSPPELSELELEPSDEPESDEDESLEPDSLEPLEFDPELLSDLALDPPRASLR